MKPLAKILALCASAAMSGAALAQSPLAFSPSPGAASAAVFDPQQLPAYKGTVQQFTLTPRGEIDGLILVDGTEVKVPPHLSTEIAYILKPGDAVTVHGLRAAALPLIAASSITSDATGQSVVDTGRAGPGPRRGPPAAAAWDGQPGAARAQGRVIAVLHGREGEVNGAVLEDRTILRMPPFEAQRFAALLVKGQMLVVRGDAMTTALGTVIEVRAIGNSADQLSYVDGPPGPGRPGGPKAKGPKG